jgi:radical SAM superfamily enzyme YgiQ (UPF0313 family)
MRIVFVDNLLLEHGSWSYHFDLQPHLGLISLVATAEALGHEAILLDPKLLVWKGDLLLNESLYSELACAIRDLKPDVVGFTSLGCNFICTVKVASYLKAMDPAVPVLLGGPHASILDRQIIQRFPQFDVVVRNEAEETLPPLLDGLLTDRLDGVRGITYRRQDAILATPSNPPIADLDGLPWPAYERYPIGELGLTSIRVEAGRGCPFDCTFCSTASFFGRRYRLKSPQRLCAELDYLHDRYGISQFALMHDLFTVNKAKVRDFCDEVESRGYTWRCSARMDCVDAELLDRMYAAGCRSIYYGVESGSPRMQKIVSKHLDLGLVHPILDATVTLGMTPTASFITGYPEEEQEDQDLTLDLISSCVYRYPETLTIQLHLLTPEPGTRLIEEFAGALDYDGHVSDFNFPTLEADDSTIMHQYPEVFMNHHYYRGQLPRRQHTLITSAYMLLYKLGFVVLRNMLDFYGRSFSRLFAEMLAWREREAPERAIDTAFVVDFVTQAWGADHYMVSLTKYMFAACELARRLEQNPRKPAAIASETSRQTDSQYMLSDGVTILRDLHDCVEILKILGSAGGTFPEISEVLRNGRGDFVIFQESVEPRRIRNFSINGSTAQLLEYFAVPHSHQEFMQRFDDVLTYGQPLDSVFHGLVERGVIRSVSTPMATSVGYLPTLPARSDSSGARQIERAAGGAAYP